MIDNPVATALVLLLVAISVAVTIFARRFTRTTADFYVGGRGIGTAENAFALSGDFMSAATFLGIAGLVWLYGFDGIWYAIGFFGGWILLLLFLASPLRRFGAYTVADFVSGRFHSKKLRLAGAMCTILISVFYIVPQMVGVGDLLVILLRWDYTLSVIFAGVLMTAYVAVGGMRGTTLNQMIQCWVLWTAMFIVVAFALHTIGFDTSHMMETVRVDGFQNPNNWPATQNFQNSFSLIAGLILGVSGLPHILVRYYTNPSSKSARWATVYAIFIMGTFYMMAPVAGFAARFLLGDKGGINTALPLLAQYLGGETLMGIVIAGAVAAILSTVVGLIIATTGAVAHDIYTNLVNPEASEEKQVLVAKIAAIAVGLFSILTGIMFKGFSVAFLVGLAFSIAASTFFPVLFMGIWWRGTTEKGAIAGLILGMVSSTGIIATNLLGLHGLANPSIITVPLSFLTIYIVSKFDGQVPPDTDEFMRKVHTPETGK